MAENNFPPLLHGTCDEIEHELFFPIRIMLQPQRDRMTRIHHLFTADGKPLTVLRGNKKKPVTQRGEESLQNETSVMHKLQRS